jgi:ferritin-like metal-binding protein YciE
MKITSLEGLFLHELADLYDAELQLLQALPKMAKAAASAELVAAFESHFRETQEHVTRLEAVFNECGESPRRRRCQGMKGLIAEGTDVEIEGAPDAVRDAALIVAAQRAEHYEMAVYGSLRTWASLLGFEAAQQLLQRTLEEEETADKILTKIASGINSAATEAQTADSDAADTGDEGTKRRKPGARKSPRTRATTGR